MMSPRIPKNVVAITPGGNITMDHIMGFYALWTVPDEPVSASKLQRLWISEGLPPNLIPRTREAKHVFQQACRSIERRSRSTDATGRRQEIEVDPVMESAKRVVYQITSLIRDETNEVIDHPKAMRVAFDKEDETITCEPLDRNAGLEQEDLDAMQETIQTYFDKNSKKVPGPRVRSGVRALMKEIGATNIRKKAGGVYFVPKDGKPHLDALNTVLDGLWEDKAELHLICAANAEGERELVERHFTVNVSEEVDELMAEVTEALTGEGRRMRKDRVGNILSQRKSLGELREKYSGLIDSSLQEIEAKLGLLDQQLEQLVLKSNATD